MKKKYSDLTLEEKLENTRIRHQIKEVFKNWYTKHLIHRFPKYENQEKRIYNYVGGKIYDQEMQDDFLSLMSEIKNS